MGKIEKIRRKIKELRGELFEGHNYYLDNSEQALGYSAALDDIWQFLDTLSEEPDKSLEEEISRTYHDGSVTDTENIDHVAYDNIARHFAGWQARQLLQGSPMPEDTVLFQKGVAEGRRLEREDMLKDAVECELYWDGDFLAIDLDMAALGYSEKDKVKVIVIKEGE